MTLLEAEAELTVLTESIRDAEQEREVILRRLHSGARCSSALLDNARRLTVLRESARRFFGRVQREMAKAVPT